MNPRNPVNGATVLTLGILSLVLCPVLGPVAWSMSSNALGILDEYEPRTGDISQRGLVVAGRICGMIGTAFLSLGLCLVLLRSCAQSELRSRSQNGPGITTVTIDGRPATPEEQKMIEEQINKNPPPSGSHSPAGSTR